MTFDEWWDTSRPAMTPDTFMGWEASCRQAWYAARKHEPESVPELRAQLQTLGLCCLLYTSDAADDTRWV